MLLNTLLSRQSTRNVIHIRNQINAIRSSQIRRFSINKEQFEISDEVQDALKNNKPIVALESTIISHGMSYPRNLTVARNCESLIRNNGCIEKNSKRVR